MVLFGHLRLDTGFGQIMKYLVGLLVVIVGYLGIGYILAILAQNAVVLVLWPWLLWLIFKELVIDRILRKNRYARKSNNS